jgi:hypothetical protein
MIVTRLPRGLIRTHRRESVLQIFLYLTFDLFDFAVPRYGDCRPTRFGSALRRPHLMVR